MRVLPRVGLDDVRFGMSQGEVRELLGEPEDRAVHQEGEDETVAWYYWARGLSAHFDSDVDWRLTTLEISAADAELEGHRLIGVSLDEVRSTLSGVEFGWSGEELEPVVVEDWNVNLWIEEGVLRYIQWSVPIGDDDEECWPS